MNHESQAQRLRSERPDTKPEPAKPDAQVRLQERQALQELPRDQRRERPSHQEGRGVLSPDLGRQRPVRYFSTFSGIGGFELGIERACDAKRTAHRREQSDTPQNDEAGARLVAPTREAISAARGQAGSGNNNVADQRPLCVGYSEIDKYAAQIYQTHFPNHHNYGDITKIDADALPDFDLYVGGFPCQAFSIAGKRGGFDDTRGTLFFDVARLLKAKRPQHFILENVKGLLSHDDGRTFKTIIATLVELGYGVEWQVLNSKDFGVPQNRERVIIVGHFGNGCTHQVFPLSDNADVPNGAHEPDEGRSKAEVSHMLKGSNVKTDQLFILDTRQKSADGKEGKSVAREYTDSVPTLNSTMHRDMFKVQRGINIRRLTPTECERLQGFPDGWTEGVSDTQRYKTLGNAVSVNVIEAVVSAMYN